MARDTITLLGGRSEADRGSACVCGLNFVWCARVPHLGSSVSTSHDEGIMTWRRDPTGTH